MTTDWCSRYLTQMFKKSRLGKHFFRKDLLKTSSPGIMLVVWKPTKHGVYLPLKILSMEDGQVRDVLTLNTDSELKELKNINTLVRADQNLDCESIFKDFGNCTVVIEQFSEKLLIKAQMKNLQILDVSLFIRYCF